MRPPPPERGKLSENACVGGSRTQTAPSFIEAAELSYSTVSVCSTKRWHPSNNLCFTVEHNMQGHWTGKSTRISSSQDWEGKYYDEYFKKPTTHIQSHLGYLVVITFLSKFNPHVVLYHVLPSKPSFRGHLGALMELRSPLSIS